MTELNPCRRVVMESEVSETCGTENRWPIFALETLHVGQRRHIRDLRFHGERQEQ